MAELGLPSALGATQPPVRSEEADEPNVSVSKEIFAEYKCRSAALAHARPHPGDIAEASSLSAIPLPPSDYPLTDSIPMSLITSGKLSQLQLEGILHACTKHNTILPSGERCGFFIGDGAGVGKGRQISGVIIDSFCRGRKLHCWISTSTDLYHDALRDFRDLGCHMNVINNLQSLDKATNTPQEGVMFATYATLTSTVKGKSRLQQLIQWLGGPSFDGCLVFDEAHKAKHFSSKESGGTKVATAVVELQKQLPLARVMYCSATGVSEVGNMAYMSRLNLWGPGSAFASFDDFVSSLKKKGLPFLEQLAMELKFEGVYVARGLSFRSAEFLELGCQLDPGQVAMYDAASAVWTELRSSLVAASAATGSGKDVWKPFWSAQQRFFKLLCVSIKVPAVVKEAQEALNAGHAVVIGLQSTGEAAMNALKLHPGDQCGHISVTKEILLQFVENHFPTVREGGQQLVQMPGPDGNLTVVAVPVPSQSVSEATRLKAAILEKIQALTLPPNFLDELIDKLGGTKNVAEMTGRKARVVRDARGKLVYELRAAPESQAMDSLNINEQHAYMDGHKLVAIVSDAASTGISLHASAVRKNQCRRIHLTVELPWSADKAIQQLGRSHRSNQVSAPMYKLVFTDLGGEKRFAAAVARRLQSLGALTRGDRRAASGLDLGSLNFDSPLGRQALRKMYDALVMCSPLMPDGVTLDKVLEGLPEEEAALFRPRADATGRSSAADLIDAHMALHKELRVYVDIMGVGVGLPQDGTAEDTGPAIVTNAKDLGDVRRFLNRLLGAPVSRQRILFSYFQQVLDAEIKAARKAGYVEGVSDLPGQKIQREGAPQVLWVDASTGLQTVRHDLMVDRGIDFAAACDRLEHERRFDDKSSFYISRRPMPGTGLPAVLLALQKPNSTSAFTITRPNTGPSGFEMDIDDLASKYTSCTKDRAEPLWVEAYTSSLIQCIHGPRCQHGAACSVGRRLTPVTILAGSIVRIWDTLERVLQRHELELSKSDRMMRIVRVELGEALPLIGVRYPGWLLPEVVAVLATLRDLGQQQGGTGGGQGGAGACRVQKVTAVDLKFVKKAFQAPRTILSMFAAKAKGKAPGFIINNTSCGGTNTQGQEVMPIGAGSTSISDTNAGGSMKRGAEESVSEIQESVKIKKQASMSTIDTDATTVEVQNVLTETPGNTTSNTVHVPTAGPPAAIKTNVIEPSEGMGKVPGEVEALIGMGFNRSQAEKALKATGNNLERAANWLLGGG